MLCLKPPHYSTLNIVNTIFQECPNVQIIVPYLAHSIIPLCIVKNTGKMMLPNRKYSIILCDHTEEARHDANY